MKLQYEQEKIPNKEHVLWYGGDVCQAEKDGVTVTLRANGDVVGNYWENNRCWPISDKQNQGRFYKEFHKKIPNDAVLMRALENNKTGNIPQNRLDLCDTNWWEVFIDCEENDSQSIVLEAEFYTEAVNEMLEILFEETQNTVYVYLQYDDGEAYGEQICKLFQSRTQARKHLKNAVETAFQADWNEVVRVAEKDDTVTEDYVSIQKSSGDCCFFTITACPVT